MRFHNYSEPTTMTAGTVAVLLCFSLVAVCNSRVMNLELLSGSAVDRVRYKQQSLHDSVFFLLLNFDAQGAVCLDGSPPGYYIGNGSGSGVNKWIVHQGGGRWCNTTDDCFSRSKTALGSSTLWPRSLSLNGIFSDEESVNGEFYNWNVVYLGYCDGGSFSGYR